MRVINLAAPAARAGASAENAGTRTYHHRWPVRMHKVRQWYPSLGQHKVIWRGPYIKGPHQAPLLLRDTAYKVDV
ncbi:hypothetical protein N566_23350 [Streptomycetaceae bacterium MP113-05]|nr:hypothetical protein N566_23350 [Streptomycetaceae bacterium MP113-05]